MKPDGSRNIGQTRPNQRRDCLHLSGRRTLRQNQRAKRRCLGRNLLRRCARRKRNPNSVQTHQGGLKGVRKQMGSLRPFLLPGVLRRSRTNRVCHLAASRILRSCYSLPHGRDGDKKGSFWFCLCVIPKLLSFTEIQTTKLPCSSRRWGQETSGEFPQKISV